MITMLQPLSAGNAVRVFLQPPSDAVTWRVLRKDADTFVDENDPAAIVVHQGDASVFVDSEWLLNDVAAFYRPYYQDADGNWEAGTTEQITPTATFVDQAVDPLSFLRSRIEYGMAVEIERGNFTTEINQIQVLTAPPSLEGSIRFPAITLHLDGQTPVIRGVGEYIGGDDYNQVDNDWDDTEGWIEQVQISVIAWSLNSDERCDLRQALRRIIIANLPVLDDKGLIQVEFRAQDVDALSGEYGAPVYQVMGTFTCLAPARVGADVPAINTIETTQGVSL